MREHTGAIQVEVKLSENGEKLCNYSKSCDFTQARDLVIAKVMSELRMSDIIFNEYSIDRDIHERLRWKATPS